jgi:hypothetical protein
VDPSSKPSAKGDFGAIQPMMNDNWYQQDVGPSWTIPADASNKWYHVSYTIPKGLGNAMGPGF